MRENEKRFPAMFRHPFGKRVPCRRMFPALLSLAAMLICLLFGGWHEATSRGAFEVPDEFDESKQIEITFWAKNDSNANQTAIYEKAIADFQALYPNVKVTMRKYTDYGKIYNDVITNISTNTTPNVCITYPDHIATYLTGENVVVPLDDLFVDEKYGLGGSELKFDGPDNGEIIPEFLEECNFGGYFYAVPYMRSTEACYINKTYVEALGYEVPDVLTWDFIWEVSEAATAKNDDGTFAVNGQKVMIPFIYKSTDNMMIQMLRQLGAGFSTSRGEVLLFSDETKELLYTISEHARTGAFSTFKISGYPANFLNAGQCIFAIDSTAGSTWMGTEAPLVDIPEENIVEFETAVRMIPQFDPENPQMISQGPSICIFNKEDEQEVLASWLFVQYLLTNEIQIAYAQTEGYVPVTSKAQESDEYQDYLSRSGENNEMYYPVKIQATQLLLDNTENTFVTAVFNGSASLRDAASQMVEDVAKGVRRKKTVDDAFIDNEYESVTRLYHLDQMETREGTDTEGTRKDLGPLPAGAKALLMALAAAWAGIAAFGLKEGIRKKKSNQEK